MIDILGFNESKTDLILKDYQAFRVKSTLKEKGFYKYFADYGINIDFWVKSKSRYDIKAFEGFLHTELLKWNILVERVTVSKKGDSIDTLLINIKIQNEEEEQFEL